MNTQALPRIHLYYFGGFLLLEALWLVCMIDHISLSSYEARLYASHSLVAYLADSSTAIFGKNDYGYRLPFVGLYLCNLILFYALSLKTLKKPCDALWAVGVFALTPVANLSALMIGEGGITLAVALIILNAHYTPKCQWLCYPLLLLSLWVSPSFIILYIAFCTYAFFEKNVRLCAFSALLLMIRIYLGNLGIFGSPKAYFLDTIGIFALLFSPLLFIYYTYTLYRICVKETKDLIWHVAFVALLFCLILSMRQKIPLDSFVPFMIVGIILCVRTFLSSLRVRLKPFRRIHTLCLKITLSMLVVCFLTLVGNKCFYPLLQVPSDHFAYKFHIVNELAKALKAHDIQALSTNNTKLASRLALYGITQGGSHMLTKTPMQDSITIAIEYLGVRVATYYITPHSTHH